jgi:hypothetical protein
MNIKVFTVFAVVGVEELAAGCWLLDAGSGEMKCQETGQTAFCWASVLVVK